MSARRGWVVGGVLVALPVAVWLGWSAWAHGRWRTALRAWEAERGPPRLLLERFPAARANEEALELERAAAFLGIGLAAGGSPRHLKVYGLSQNVVVGLGRYIGSEGLSTSPGTDAPPKDAERFLEASAADIAHVVHLSQRRAPPRWEVDADPKTTARAVAAWLASDWLGRPPGVPLDLSAHFELQEVLIAGALADVHRGDLDRAAGRAWASAWLDDGLAERPEPAVQLARSVTTRQRQAALRALPESHVRWAADRPRTAPDMRASIEWGAWTLASLMTDEVLSTRLHASTPQSPAEAVAVGASLPRLLRADHDEAARLLDDVRKALAADERAGTCGSSGAAAGLMLLWYLEDVGAALQAAAVADFDAELTRVILAAQRDRRPRVVPGSCADWSFRIDVSEDGRLNVTTLGTPPRASELPDLATVWVEPRR